MRLVNDDRPELVELTFAYPVRQRAIGDVDQPTGGVERRLIFDSIADVATRTDLGRAMQDLGNEACSVDCRSAPRLGHDDWAMGREPQRSVRWRLHQPVRQERRFPRSCLGDDYRDLLLLE